MNKLGGYLSAISHIAIFKTIFVNILALPIRQAIRFPILIGRGTTIKSIGKFRFNCPVSPGLFSIGVYQLFNTSRHHQSILSNKGTIEMGGKVILYSGCAICLATDALLKLGGVIRWVSIA